MFEGRTILDIQQERGFTTGFDYLRVILACSVVLWHSFPLSYGAEISKMVASSYYRPFVSMILFAFFALSGFLVAGSLERYHLPTFMSLRALRLVPALLVEILLSALLLGPILTQLPLSAYFTSKEFFSYFLNVAGLIHYTLPGVFNSNVYPDVVNGSLWTIPFELECYVALMLIAAFGIYQRRRLLLLGVLAVCLLMIARGLYTGVEQTISNGRVLVLCFLAGVIIYAWRDRVVLSKSLVATMIVGSYLLMLRTELFPLAAFTSAYVTVYIGMTSPKLVGFLKAGDYSYGLYLFAFPIQQMIAIHEPMRHWWVVFPTATALGLCYAAFSWHCVEKPVLGKKKLVISFMERYSSNVSALLSRTLKLKQAM